MGIEGESQGTIYKVVSIRKSSDRFRSRQLQISVSSTGARKSATGKYVVSWGSTVVLITSTTALFRPNCSTKLVLQYCTSWYDGSSISFERTQLDYYMQATRELKPSG